MHGFSQIFSMPTPTLHHSREGVESPLAHTKLLNLSLQYVFGLVVYYYFLALSITIKKVRSLVAAIPLAWITLFYLFVLRAYIQLGKIPTYGAPDPKELNYDVHYAILFFLMPVCLLSILIYPLILFLSRKFQPISFKEIFLFLLGFTLLTIQIRHDPLQLLNWFMD